ncbi:hypothetical protein D3C76_1165670 [compost metagenome]
MQVLGAVIQQLLHELVRARVADVLVVIDHQEQLFVDTGSAFDDGRHHLVDELRPRALQRHAAVHDDAKSLQRAT